MDSTNAPQSALEVLRTVEFKLGIKGYNVDEVDEFLERAAVEAEHLKDQLRQQQQQLRQAAERINQLDAERRAGGAPAPAPAPAAAPVASAPVSAASSEQITQMIAMAQKFVEQTQHEAETRARDLTLAAQDKAKEIVSDAQNRAQDEVTRLNGLKQRLSEDVEKLTRQIDSERSRLRTQLSDFLRWIDDSLQTPPVSRAVPAPPLVAPVVPIAPEPVMPPPPPVPVSNVVHMPERPEVVAEVASDVPPPAPARTTPTTIGQMLNFDENDRS